MKNIIRESQQIEEEYENDDIIMENFDPDEPDYTFAELLAVMSLFVIVAGILVAIFSKDKFYDMSGFLMGAAIAYFMVWHMNRAAKNALMLPEASVKGYIIKHYVIRLLVVLAVMVGMVVFQAGNIIISLLGIMALKVAAYLQPFTDKLFKKIRKKGG